jgi:purine nucleoside permease
MKRLWLFLACTVILAAAPKPKKVKAVVVTLFERGADTGDQPGEFQNWVERVPLNESLPFPSGYRNLRWNGQKQVLGVCTGVATARATASIMALGHDPRFDLRDAYWLVAGIAGGDPADTTVGSVVWADYVLDGDLAHEIDAREIPADWPTGYIPLRKSKPYEKPLKPNLEGEVYRLDHALVDWAFAFTKDVALLDNDKLAERRSLYTGFAGALRTPGVQRGDTLSAGTFWHGRLMNQWANDWTRYYTNNEGNYVTTAMEDSGVMQSLTWLARAGKVDLRRVLVLRAVSNFDMPPSDVSAADSLRAMENGKYHGFLESLENLYRVGSRALEGLLARWPR